jgi:hypothetical protein
MLQVKQYKLSVKRILHFVSQLTLESDQPHYFYSVSSSENNRLKTDIRPKTHRLSQDPATIVETKLFVFAFRENFRFS